MKEEESRSGGGSELAEALVKLRGAAADDSVVGVDGGGGYGGVEVELAGAVSRRRAWSKDLLFLDVVVEDELHGSQTVALVLASELLGPLRQHVCSSARAGDKVVGKGMLRLAPAAAAAASELRCSALTITSKWDQAALGLGSFAPPAVALRTPPVSAG
ncbi:hypothetical protein T484DRAFT_1876432, partial [Baffinella frigidus]